MFVYLFAKFGHYLMHVFVKFNLIGGSCRDSSVERGEFDYLFATPETLVGDQHWRSKKKLKKYIELVNTSNTINYNCRRASMLAPFHTAAELSQLKEVEPVHSCCDLCYTICKCGFCSQTHIEKLLNFTLEEISEDENTDENTEPCTCKFSDDEDIDNWFSDLNIDDTCNKNCCVCLLSN